MSEESTSRHGKRTLKHTLVRYVGKVNTLGKRTLKHTRVRYVWRVKTWYTYIKEYTCTLCLEVQDMVNVQKH